MVQEHTLQLTTTAVITNDNAQTEGSSVVFERPSGDALQWRHKSKEWETKMMEEIVSRYNEAPALQAENIRLREALEKIAFGDRGMYEIQTTAKAALRGDK